MEQYYKIAGLVVAMDCFGRTQKQAMPYQCEEQSPDIIIDSNWRSLYNRHDYLGEDDCAYVYSATSFYRQLLRFDGLMLHSSAVVVDGKAYLFSATSGTGKSTHTQLWLKQFGDRALILNDDKPALRLEEGVWYAYGTPWSGKYDISTNLRVPLAGIALIERAETNSIQPYGGKNAIFELMSQTVRPKSAGYRMRLLEMIDKLLTGVPVWKLKCNMEPEAARVSYEAMSGNKI